MDTKEKILLSAAEEFSANGYHGTTVRNICQLAKVNIAAVNYHFSSKKVLYKYVVEYLYAKIEHKNISTLNLETEEEWRQAIFCWVNNLLTNVTNPLLHYQWINRIFFREMLDTSEVFPEFFEKYFKPYFSSIEPLVRLGLPSDIDKPAVYTIIFSVFSQCLFYEQNKIIVSQILDDKFLENKKQRKRIVKLITNSVCSNLKFNTLTH